ncbi:phage tail protein [Rahnella victoriana]|uniref:phage major tail tube protein n=1 Tax=Rahnella victoriana TaxID=1510570 RepID=UPI000BB1C09E|nr:phage major tail tube protein [Rahnella victoriana]PBI79739.1 phage tail protein [Rahnella victoriana]
MALPRKLKYLNLFNDGLSYMGVVQSVTLPKLTRKLENYRGGGMNGSAAVDFGLDDDALTVEWSMGGLPDETLWAQYASAGAADVPLRFAGSFQRDDTGDMKQGEDTESKITTQCSYYKLVIDGKTLIEIDTVNMVEIVNGTDMLEKHRRNIGL